MMRFSCSMCPRGTAEPSAPGLTHCIHLHSSYSPGHRDRQETQDSITETRWVRCVVARSRDPVQ